MASIEKRTTEAGETVYRVKVRLKGYPTQTATFKRLTDARKWAQSTEAAIREGRHFKTAEAKKHTLSDLIARYERDVIPTKKPKQQVEYARHLRWWKERYGYLLLADVTPATISEGRDALLSEPHAKGGRRAPATVAKALAVLSHACTVAVNEWGWLQDNPARKVKKPTFNNGRVRFLDDNERARLLKACKQSSNPYLYPVVVLALSTGMRQGEIMNLEWHDVDLAKGSIVLHHTKNGERRRVALVGPALEVLREHSKVRRLDSPLVFPGNTGKPALLRKPWLNALKEAEITDFKFHDLRHSCASYLAMNGATPGEIAEVLGHKTLAMVKRYSHLSETHIRGVLEDMAQKVF
ncbi:tyrosine-type recombinase/integrase [Methylohalobius crimeensis]|uniref:tyrosine-type recombinase/integrase n=1 Tax=Methylohalobius crimeensis TaxID=244365 RepID=UPI0003B7AA4E|nr:site-specific integrase [Methylohalobius crimeensis]